LLLSLGVICLFLKPPILIFKSVQDITFNQTECLIANKRITSTVAAKVNLRGNNLISLAFYNPKPIIAICNASVPFAQGITCVTPSGF